MHSRIIRPTSALRFSLTGRLAARSNGTAETESCNDVVDYMASLRRSAIWSCRFWRPRVMAPVNISAIDAIAIPLTGPIDRLSVFGSYHRKVGNVLRANGTFIVFSGARYLRWASNLAEAAAVTIGTPHFS